MSDRDTAYAVFALEYEDAGGDVPLETIALAIAHDKLGQEGDPHVRIVDYGEGYVVHAWLDLLRTDQDARLRELAAAATEMAADFEHSIDTFRDPEEMAEALIPRIEKNWESAGVPLSETDRDFLRREFELVFFWAKAGFPEEWDWPEEPYNSRQLQGSPC